MADTKISNLTEGSAIVDTDEFPAVETAGVGPVKKLATKIQTYVLGTSGSNTIVKTGFFLRNDGWVNSSFGMGFDIWYSSGGGIYASANASGVVFAGYLKTSSSTVASLPSAATEGSGSRRFVTDANATTFNSIVAGSGANNVPVFSDGTNWRIG